MSKEESRGGDLFIVDNSDSDWKVKQYLREWADLASKFDIATGYFEIGALLALDGQWQKLDQLRILMGDPVSLRTKKALISGVERMKTRLDDSIEKEKEQNDFLLGVPAILSAIAKKQIQCKVYTKDKFHAKAYITHAKQAVIGSVALVGSSNFTFPGLTTNIELNIQIRREVEELQAWYEKHWNTAEDISDDVLKVIERHVRDYSPFEVYAKSLQEFFKGHELTVGEWELSESIIYNVLDNYQQEGYRSLMKIASQHNGAFLCDGVGLGKTLVGLMLIERLCTFDRKRVALFVPKAANAPVWETHLKKYLPRLRGDFSNLAVYNHTDLSREGDWEDKMARIGEQADVIIIDEAHHFRNRGIKGEGTRKPSRYRKMYEVCEGKTVFLLTATPINNKLADLHNMISLFSREDKGYFKAAPLGIHSLPGHFLKMERALKKLIGESPEALGEINQLEAERILRDDTLFRALVVQRSRAYVRASNEQQGKSSATFPFRDQPRVVNYSMKETYGALLKKLEDAFEKENPLFTLANYYPLFYLKNDKVEKDAMEEGRQKEVVALIRTKFLKRFESSVKAFELSCVALMQKLLAFQSHFSTTKSQKSQLKKWNQINEEILTYANGMRKYFATRPLDDDEDDDFISSDLVESFKEYEIDNNISRSSHRVEDMITATQIDLDQIVEFLRETKKFKPSNDDKLTSLIQLLSTEDRLKNDKVLIFTEFMHTAKYLQDELVRASIKGVDEIDSSDSRDRSETITRFSPYYNGSNSTELEKKGLTEIRVLLSTDVLSEGLNLQDASCMINYDLHWNPVRLMQRIGRVDRRLSPDIEKAMLSDHPSRKGTRGTVQFWNFLPPDELEDILKLYARVSHKTLRISKVFGIEGKKLLKPDDDFDALKEFIHTYEGTTSTIEDMHLEYQRLLKAFPELEQKLEAMPGRLFSGKQHPKKGTQSVFFCYALPGQVKETGSDGSEEIRWEESKGLRKWYLFDLGTEKILDEPDQILDLIRSKPTTPRRRSLPDASLTEIRVKLEVHIKNTYLKQVQAPVGVKANLKAWMELS
ncbi:MAG: helicase-related protein [candidate division Zixibacteria bacterium]|nr:helicase-related protein [candidate division Zixibacteria bacterium]